MCVEGASVQDGFVVDALVVGEETERSIHAMTCPSAGEMGAMRSVGQTLAHVLMCRLLRRVVQSVTPLRFFERVLA